ncbi:magnesium transporter [Bowmanella denitrificans]|uniref:Magnesium transporter n=1 Tax=Bowmanella denitrificans TaxID=366582 RepID=A0ABN0XMR3_9ALTE|nr:NAD/FAD-utilizing enzyme [Bowmanella denitrificans]
MLRYYYLSNDLHDLAKVEEDMQRRGFSKPHFHVLSEHDAEVEQHHLNAIEPVLKKDVVHSTETGALFGILAAVFILAMAYWLGWTDTAAGWLPFVFLAVVVLGFCTWEGGLIGIQVPNRRFKRFQTLLAKGHHILFVDVDQSQELVLSEILQQHPGLKQIGTGETAPRWVVKGQEKFDRFMKAMP